jgi:hypothetical protein
MMQLFAQLSPEKILHPDATLAEIARERDAVNAPGTNP